MKNSKFLKVLLIIIDVIYFIGVMYLGYVFGESLPGALYDLEVDLFLFIFSLVILCFLLLFYVLNFLSIILHEVGHLLFGLKAKLKFISFTIWNIAFTKNNDKLKIEKKTAIPGIGGYCVMITDNNIKYTKDSIMFYYLGGIMFNIILACLSLGGILLVDYKLVEVILWMLFVINVYYALYNLVPAVNVSGNVSDTMHLFNYFDDDNYMHVISNIQEVQNMLVNGIELKDVDPKYIKIPKVFKNNSDILCGLIYMDYLSSLDKYNDIIKYSNKMLNECGDLLSKQDVITIKLQLINSLFFLNKEDEIKELWNQDIRKYLDTMGGVAPVFIIFNYMYSTLIDKNSDDSKKYLEQFNKLNRKRPAV